MLSFKLAKVKDLHVLSRLQFFQHEAGEYDKTLTCLEGRLELHVQSIPMLFPCHDEDPRPA